MYNEKQGKRREQKKTQTESENGNEKENVILLLPMCFRAEHKKKVRVKHKRTTFKLSEGRI